MMRGLMVSLPQKHLIAILLGVCILSAGIGSGLALIAQEGPEGPRGKQGQTGKPGPEGPEGAEGASGAAEVEGLEAEVAELRDQLEEGADLGQVEGRIDELEAEIEGLGGVQSELCSELDFLC
jgi:hypothetical protein